MLYSAISAALDFDGYKDLNRVRELPGMARAAADTLISAWNADLDLQALAGMSNRMHDIALLERRVRQALPAGALIAPALKAAALERRSFAKKLFGPITLDGIVDVEPVWRPLIAALASETTVEWSAPDGVDRSWFKGQLAIRPLAKPKSITGDICADPRSEAVEALRWARELLSRGDVKAAEIAIVATSPAAWDNHFLALIAHADLPLHFSHGISALASADGQACASLADVLLSGIRSSPHSPANEASAVEAVCGPTASRLEVRIAVARRIVRSSTMAERARQSAGGRRQRLRNRTHAPAHSGNPFPRRRRREGRTDASDGAIEIVTMHSSKGLEWPVVIPINTATILRSPPEFVHRQSDNTLHWVLGGVTPTDLLGARQEEEQNQARERERVWYVACTRARDMLILPHLKEASTRSWSKTVVLGHARLPEARLKDLPKSNPSAQAPLENKQTPEVFAAQAVQVVRASPDIEWKRPSDKDQDRAETFEITPGETADPLDSPVPLAGGRLRGILLHKLMEEFLTGELAEDEASAQVRARVLLGELVGVLGLADGTQPDPGEAAKTAFSTLRLPEVTSLRAEMSAEIPIWASQAAGSVLAGRADAMAIDHNGTITAEKGTYSTIAEISTAEKINETYVGRVLRLTLLAPDIIEAILNGRQPARLQLKELFKGFPVGWQEQRAGMLDPN